MRIQGEIVSWNQGKGFGFVKPTDGGKEIFIHIKEFNWKPQVGQKITFSIGQDKQGRTCGKTAILSGDFLEYEKSTGSSFMQILLGLIALLTIAVLSFVFEFTHWLPIVYIGASMLTYFIYWIDKNAALSGGRRTPENTLHLLSLFCGWPGALIAQQKLRHKTKKQPFRFIFWLTVVVNIGGIYYLTLKGVI